MVGQNAILTPAMTAYSFSKTCHVIFKAERSEGNFFASVDQQFLYTLQETSPKDKCNNKRDKQKYEV